MNIQMKSTVSWMRLHGRKLKLALIVMLSAAILATGAPNYSTVSGAFAADTAAVVLSVAEADSLVELIDDQELSIRLLQIRLQTARHLASNDSTLAYQRLMLQKRMHEQVLKVYRDDRGSMFRRALMHPSLWFMLGAYAGLRVVR